MRKVFRRRHRLENEREHDLKMRGFSTQLDRYEWPFHDDLWLRFLLKTKTRGGPMIFQDEVSRLKTYLVTIVIATNPASALFLSRRLQSIIIDHRFLFFENRTAWSPLFVRWFRSCVGLNERTTRSDYFHRLRVLCDRAAYVVFRSVSRWTSISTHTRLHMLRVHSQWISSIGLLSWVPMQFTDAIFFVRSNRSRSFPLRLFSLDHCT